MEGKYLTTEVLESGDLKLTLTKEGRREIKQAIKERPFGWTVDDFFAEMESSFHLFEDIQCNSELSFLYNLGAYGLGLTDSPGFIDGEVFVEVWNGWWYPNYAVKNFVKELYLNGSVTFDKWQHGRWLP